MTRMGELTTGSTATTASGETSGLESVEVADGEHGAELAVECALALPPDPDVMPLACAIVSSASECSPAD